MSIDPVFIIPSPGVKVVFGHACVKGTTKSTYEAVYSTVVDDEASKCP